MFTHYKVEIGNNISCITDFRHLDEKKKKRKCSKVETHVEFPGREKVKFGEVVEAPPKLSFPKVASLLTSFCVNSCTSLFSCIKCMSSAFEAQEPFGCFY